MSKWPKTGLSVLSQLLDLLFSVHKVFKCGVDNDLLRRVVHYIENQRRQKSPAVAKVGRPYRLYRKPAPDFRSRKDSDFLEWLQSYTRYGDAAISYATINVRIKYGNLAHACDGCRQQLCIQNCGQTAAAICSYRRHRPTVNDRDLYMQERLVFTRYHTGSPHFARNGICKEKTSNLSTAHKTRDSHRHNYYWQPIGTRHRLISNGTIADPLRRTV